MLPFVAESWQRQASRWAGPIFAFCLLVLPGRVIGGPGSAERLAPIIREVRLERTPVFSESERDAARWLPLGLVNRLHANTRAGVIRRELVFGTGDRLDPLDLDESERKLRALRIFRRVEIDTIAVSADTVDVVVRTQELWTTAIDANYEKFEDQRLWNVQMRERNFLGTARSIELERSVDIDRSSWTFGAADPQLFGTRWLAAVRFNAADDGDALSATLGRPFFRLDDEWSWLGTVSDRTSSPRFYIDDTRYVRPEGEFTDLRIGVARRLHSGPAGVWRWSLGYGLRTQELGASAPLPVSDAVGELGETFDFPAQPSENRSWRTPYVGIERRTRTYEKLRFVNAMGSVEDVPIGPEFELRTGWTTRALGSTQGGTYVFANGSWFGWLSRLWLYRVQTQLEGLVDAGGTDLRSVTTVAGYHTLRPGLSLALGSVFGMASRADRHRVFGLGLESGLRAARFRELSGDRLWRTHAELRAIYTKGLWGVITPGIAVFGDVGTAWFESSTDFRTDLLRGAVGVGLRIGFDRAANDVPIRVDLAWPVLYPIDQSSPVLSVGTGHVF